MVFQDLADCQQSMGSFLSTFSLGASFLLLPKTASLGFEFSFFLCEQCLKSIGFWLFEPTKICFRQTGETVKEIWYHTVASLSDGKGKTSI